MPRPTIALAPIAAIMLAIAAQAQTIPPAELQLPRFLCREYPVSGQAFMKGLVSGGEWERLNATTFVYDARPRDALTGRTDHFRLIFIRADTNMACGDTKPCAILARAAHNGEELDPSEMVQLCDIIVTNGAFALENERKGSSSGGGTPQAAPRSGTVQVRPAQGNMNDPLGRRILEYEAKRAGKGMPKPFGD